MEPEEIAKEIRASKSGCNLEIIVRAQFLDNNTSEHHFSGTLADRLSTSGEHDTVFLVQSLTILVVQTSQDPIAFLREIVQVSPAILIQ